MKKFIITITLMLVMSLAGCGKVETKVAAYISDVCWEDQILILTAINAANGYEQIIYRPSTWTYDYEDGMTWWITITDGVITKIHDDAVIKQSYDNGAYIEWRGVIE